MQSSNDAGTDLRHPRIVVVGAGIAGLTAAREMVVARPDFDVVLVESTAQVGGKLRLGEVGGVRIDLGAESILNRRPEGVALAAAVGLGEATVHPATSAAAVWTRGGLHRLPPTLMGIPADPLGPAAVGILGDAGAREALGESDLPQPVLTADVAVGRFVAERLGREVRDRLVEPLLGGVYAGRSDELSLFATLPQIADAVREHGSLLAAAQSAVRNAAQVTTPVFAGIAGGVGRIARELRRDLESRGVVVLTGTTATALRRSPDGFVLTLDRPGTDVVAPLPGSRRTALDADAVVLAVPGPAASRLLSEVAPSAGVLVGEIEYASMALVTMAFDARQVAGRLDGSGFLVPPVEGRTIKASTFSSQKWGWLSGGDIVMVRCSIGRFREEHELQRDDDELVDLARSDLAEAVGLRAVPVDSTVTRWGGALPQYAVGHRDRVGLVEAAVGAVAGLEVCGAAYEGVGIPAVIANAQGAATRVIEWLGGAETMCI